MRKVEIFRGFLGEDGLTLFETVQFAMHTGLPGELVFHRGGGTIFLKEGMVIGAEIFHYRGKKALERIWMAVTPSVASFYTTSSVQDDRLRINEMELLSIQERIDGFRILIENFPPSTFVKMVSSPPTTTEMGAALASMLSQKERVLLQEILDRLPFSDTLILRTIRAWSLKGVIEVSAPTPAFERERRNVLIFSRTIAAIYAFFHALGISGKVERRGGHIYYAVRNLDPYHLHIYAVHLTPGASVRDVRNLLSLADQIIALGALPAHNLKRRIPVLIPGPGKWMDAAFREIPSLEDFLRKELETDDEHTTQGNP